MGISWGYHGDQGSSQPDVPRSCRGDFLIFQVPIYQVQLINFPIFQVELTNFQNFKSYRKIFKFCIQNMLFSSKIDGQTTYSSIFSLPQKMDSVPRNLDRLFIVCPEAQIYCLTFQLLCSKSEIAKILDLTLQADLFRLRLAIRGKEGGGYSIFRFI